MAYRAMGGPETHTIYPRGLRSDTTYRVSFADRPGEATFTVAELEAHGIELALTEFGSEIVHLAQ